MLIKKETEYAILCLISLAEKGDNNFHDAKELAQKCHLSGTLISKVLQRLSSAQIVESKSGPHGGFRLTSEPRNISLFDVFSAIQAPSILKCHAGKATYCPRPDCTLKDAVSRIENSIDDFLSNISLDDLMTNKKVIKKG